MPIKIKNIKSEEITYKSHKDFEKIVEYAKLINPDYKKFLPENPKHRMQFEITNTVSDFVNCIRKFLMEELMIYSLDVNEDNIKTNDKFILNDDLKKTIELIPLQQHLNDIDDLKISLNVKNTTDDIITVYSRQIKFTNSKGKELITENYFNGNIPIITLRSDKTLSIDNITIVKGCGKQDSGKFSPFSNISYEILDVIPLKESKYKKEGESSLNSNPTHFKISFTTYGNIKINKIMDLCCDKITSRFNNIYKELSNINSKDLVFFSSLVDLKSYNEMKIFTFKGEFWAIANIIARYCYIELPSIKFVCACITHPSIEESMIKIIHPNSIKLILTAIKNILSDIDILKKAFEMLKGVNKDKE